MSLENAKSFLEKVKSDEAFKKSIVEAGSEEEKMKLIKDAGFDFTAEELQQVRQEAGALSDEELEQVSGGCLVDSCRVNF